MGSFVVATRASSPRHNTIEGCLGRNPAEEHQDDSEDVEGQADRVDYVGIYGDLDHATIGLGDSTDWLSPQLLKCNRAILFSTTLSSWPLR